MPPASGTFQTIEPNLGDILKDIRDKKIQLPDFQRGWVWDDNRIRALIASVSLSYPIGAVMTMEVSESIRFLPRLFEGVPNGDKVVPEVLVLDGQQRFTSLYLSLLSGKVVPTLTEKKEQINRYYYLDMKKCLDQDADRFDAIVSVPEKKIVTSDFGRKIELDVSTREKEYENRMYPLSLIYNPSENTQWKNGFQRFFGYNENEMTFLGEFDENIWLPFQQYKVPVIKLTKDTPKEAVCQVFENVNTGGVSLTVFELLTATFAADNFQLRKDWEERKGQLKQQKVLEDIDESAFLTAITLLTSYKNHLQSNSSISCKRKEVLKLSLDDYKKNADCIIQGLESAAKLLAREKIFDKRNIPYQTQFIPLSAICGHLGNRIENDTVKEKIIQWYWCGVFGELYGGANETRFAFDIQDVLSWIDGGDLPRTIRDSSFSPTRLLTLQSRLSAAYKGLMALLMKKGSRDFINGDSIELTTYFDDAIDIHHIFPKAFCEKMRYDRHKWNSIVNKAPLSSRTNRILGGYKPSTYIQTIQSKENVDPMRLDEIFQSHLIDPNQIRNDEFSSFIQARAAKLLDLIENATGKVVVGRDSEEVVKEFGGNL